MTPQNDQQNPGALGLGQVVTKYVLPYNTLLAFSFGVATLANVISVWLLAGLALTLQALLVITLMLDGAFRYELVSLGKRSVARRRRVGHFLLFLWPHENARIYKTAPFWALFFITSGVSIFAAHNWQLEIERLAAKKSELAKLATVRAEEGMPVGNPVLNIPGTTAHIRAGSIIRRDGVGILRFVIADPLVQESMVGDALSTNSSGIKSAEVLAELDCERGALLRQLSVTTFPEANWGGSSKQILAKELYWRDIDREPGKFGQLDKVVEKVVCQYHRPGEPMDDN